MRWLRSSIQLKESSLQSKEDSLQRKEGFPHCGAAHKGEGSALDKANDLLRGSKALNAAADASKVLNAVDKASDTAKAVSAIDKASDTAKAVSAVDKATDTGKAISAADKAADTGKAASAADKAADTSKGAQAADKAADTSKAGQAADKTGDAGKVTKAEEYENQKKLWDKAEKEGREKVSNYKKAVESGDPDMIKKATLDVQGDKRALQNINNRNPDLKKSFNENIENLQYKPTDAKVRQRIADQYGVSPDDVKISTASNPTDDLFKVGADKDYEAIIKKNGKEITMPRKQASEIYDEEYIKTAFANDPDKLADLQRLKDTNPDEFRKTAKEFGKVQDQACMDKYHPGGYGDKVDLNTMISSQDKLADNLKAGKLDSRGNIVGYDLDDPVAVGKSMGYKSHEWFKDAEDLRKAGNYVEAEKFVAEGMRQAPKQFKILAKRHAALKEVMKSKLKDLPASLKKQVSILELVEAGLSSPAEVAKLLEKAGTTPRKVASDIGEYVEAMQVLRP